MKKRAFLKNLLALGVTASPGVNSFGQLLSRYEHIPPAQLASNEDFWAGIRAGYRLKPDYINLENGFYCFVPQETLENLIGHVREVNYQGSWYMRNERKGNKAATTARLAELGGCSPEEVVITRNATESLDLIITGIHWKEGDEAVMAEQDYGAMLNQFKLAAKRYGVVNKVVSVPNLPQSDEEIVELYAAAITPRTRLLMVSHMINITGQILPVRKICDMAHSKGVQVLVDGAHAFAHFQFNLPDLNCDYYGSSLHKWLSTPLGAGLLYVKKGNAEHVWPLLAEGERDPNDIHRLNHIGTYPAYTDLAINDAIDYHHAIGGKRKEERLRYLQTYWTSKVRDIPGVIVNTPKDPARHCGIGNVGIEGMKPAELAKVLMERYKIFTVAIDGSNVHGCRISPNLYTTLEELDVLVKACTELAKA
ncbi:aminotransferase class V-fold PLP-dependent enzyme [Cyclobacterium xiamenense]|uniref:aminotransferase class V-fold PLP-dependent enzyme n=1 Tax=Cyclobacterium xiamenense TaxID=1297121 RepID=UPI0012B91C6F|nr:aminotransferase class V-fold PLP-dependent enzyme [Cyclobacterium xiamenense]